MAQDIKKEESPQSGGESPPVVQAMEEAKVYALLDVPRMVVGHERGGEWFRLVERDGSILGPFPITDFEKIQAIINQHTEISKNVVITLDHTDTEIKLNPAQTFKDSISVSLVSGDSLQLVCSSSTLSNMTSAVRKIGLTPINVETWVTSLPRYYNRIKNIVGAIVTLSFKENSVDILLSQGAQNTAFHQLSLREGEVTERFESFKKDLANVFDFFEKRFNIKIEHLSSWNAPEGWTKDIGETYGLNLAIAIDEEFYNALAIGGSLSSVEGIRQDRLLKGSASTFLDSFKKLSTLLTKFKRLGAFGGLLLLIGVFVAAGTVLEIRNLTASSLSKKWDRSRAALNKVSLRSNKLESMQVRVTELRQLINENKQPISLSSSLADVGRDAQSGIFLTQVGYAKDEFTISGVSTSWENFLTMMDRMTKNPRFSSVSPGDVKRLITGAVQFQVVVVPRQARVFNIGGTK